jgi:uncharacterized protein YjbI with pentapeptide repeats
MKRFLACLALCASLSASAQGDNCTVLGIQDLTQMVLQLQAEIDSLKATGMTRDSVIAIAIHKELSVDEVTGGDLSTINLIGADLISANLSGANLSGAKLEFADLSDADLTGANLSGASLSYADLSDADLTGANLTGADLTDANLTGATMTCLRFGYPSLLPSGYTCEPDPDCYLSNRYRIVPD